MTLNKTLVLVALLLLAFGGVFYVLGSEARTVGAAAPPGLMTPATNATSTFLAMGSQSAQLMFATSTCNSRIITTTQQPVMLTFSDSQGKRPTGINGHLQAASTTVSYDASLFGCGAVYGFSNGAQTVSITEFRP